MRPPPSLALEAGDRIWVLGVLGRDDLQRHGAVELDVGGLVDDPHSAASHDPLDPVARKLRARIKPRQTLGGLIHDAAPSVGTFAT